MLPWTMQRKNRIRFNQNTNDLLGQIHMTKGFGCSAQIQKSLYQTKSVDPLSNITETIIESDGLEVRLWQEKNLFIIE